MEHSSAYIDFKKQLKATGRQKLDGYNPKLLDSINTEERKEIEKDIWTSFVKKDDAELAIFMPELKEYDGIGALKKKLPKFKVPSSGSAETAFVLFDVTGDKRYLDIIMDNYRGLSFNTPIVVELARRAKKPFVYPLLRDVYIHDRSETNRTQAILGILWHDGKIQNIDDVNEISCKIDMIRAFDLDSSEAQESIAMNDFDKGIFSLDKDLVITSGYAFEQFRDTKYYRDQNPERVFWLKDEFEFHDHTFKVSLFFRNEIIYMLSLLCCDKAFSMEEEGKRKDYHDEILRSWAITQSNYPWGHIESVYDPKSNISSIDIFFTIRAFD